MQAVRDWAVRWGPRQSTVAVIGPTGSGKNLLAKVLHGIRGCGKFLRVSLRDTSADMLHSELLGHVKGAFTDAKTDRVGAIEAAMGGTLFVDELQDADRRAQGMLRDLAAGEPTSPLGTHRPIVPNCRLIVGSQVPLLTLVREHGFREDLAYRLLVEEMVLPPLLAHLEDLLELVPAIVAEMAQRDNVSPLEVSPAAMAVLSGHGWPGNVRELENALRRALIEAQDDGIIQPHHLPGWLRDSMLAYPQPASQRPSGEELLGLRRRLGSFTAVAGYLRVDTRTVRRWLKDGKVAA